MTLAIPELAGRRLLALEIGGLPAGPPVAVTEDGSATVEVGARSGTVLASVA
jgi:hypothetical protein